MILLSRFRRGWRRWNAGSPVRWAPAGAFLLALSLLAPACSSRESLGAGPGPGSVLFDGTLDELIPYRSGSRFVYRATGVGGKERILTSLVWPTREKDEIIAVLLHGELLLSQMRLRLRGGTLAIVSEVGPQQDLAISYRDPLPLVSVPVIAGEKTFHTRVKLLRLSDAKVLAEGEMEQTSSVTEQSRSFGRKGWIVLHFERSLSLPGRASRSRSTIWIEPGVGQVRIEMGGDDEEPSERRDLICAVLGDRKIGDCGSVSSHE